MLCKIPCGFLATGGLDCLRRWVSNATRHPSHLRKRFLARSQELWEEVGPAFQSYKYADEERTVLMKERTSRTILASMNLLFQKYHKGSSTHKNRHLLANTITELSEDEFPALPKTRPVDKERKVKEMNSYLKQTLQPLKKEIISRKYGDDEKSKFEVEQLGTRVIFELENSVEKFRDWLEFPQYCHLLHRIGQVAYNFEDKQWIYDAYQPFIQSLINKLPPELELLTTTQLLNAFYGLACLGPQVLEMELEELRLGYSVEEFMKKLVDRAFEVMEDLNGMDRSQLLEGIVLINKRLSPERLEVLLHDAYPLLKIKHGPGVVHSDQLASLIWAMGHHPDCKDNWKICQTFLKEMANYKRFLQLKAADIGRAVYGLGKLSITTGHEDFMEKVRRFFQFNVDLTQRQMFTHEIVEFSEGLALLDYKPGTHDIFQYLLKDIIKRQTRFSVMEKERFLKACVSVGYPMKSNRK